MGKDKIIVWWLTLFLVSGLSARNRIALHDDYVIFDDLKKVIPELELRQDRLTGVVYLNKKGNEIRFRPGASFYTFGFKIENIRDRVIQKNERIYLPRELVEGIFIHLTEENWSYRFDKKFLTLEKSADEPGGSLKYIIIDAGHGGKDPGTMSESGLMEKDITLAVAGIMKDLIVRYYPGMKVILTREKDVFIPLEERSKIANKVADRNSGSVYISLHCNSTLNPGPHGFEIYFFSQSASTEAARELAIIENRIIDSKYRNEIGRIQADMLSSFIQRRSSFLAETIEARMKKKLGSLIESRGVKKADFAVLRGSLMPAVLVEMGYLSNKKEAHYLQSRKYQVKIAKSIFMGIRDYIKTGN